MWGHGAWDWVIAVAAWMFSIGVLRILGGVGAACDAIADWGRSSSRKRVAQVAPRYAARIDRTPGRHGAKRL